MMVLLARCRSSRGPVEVCVDDLLLAREGGVEGLPEPPRPVDGGVRGVAPGKSPAAASPSVSRRLEEVAMIRRRRLWCPGRRVGRAAAPGGEEASPAGRAGVGGAPAGLLRRRGEDAEVRESEERLDLPPGVLRHRRPHQKAVVVLAPPAEDESFLLEGRGLALRRTLSRVGVLVLLLLLLGRRWKLCPDGGGFRRGGGRRLLQGLLLPLTRGDEAVAAVVFLASATDEAEGRLEGVRGRRADEDEELDDEAAPAAVRDPAPPDGQGQGAAVAGRVPQEGREGHEDREGPRGEGHEAQGHEATTLPGRRHWGEPPFEVELEGRRREGRDEGAERQQGAQDVPPALGRGRERRQGQGRVDDDAVGGA
mmetsp:Transcript_22911/g.73669  ORF Transcript_22911/g.73669 Transcript_22911/m.73669 type:complete len:366 (+) Transcript_22911:1336-2433(+)